MTRPRPRICLLGVLMTTHKQTNKHSVTNKTHVTLALMSSANVFTLLRNSPTATAARRLPSSSTADAMTYHAHYRQTDRQTDRRHSWRSHINAIVHRIWTVLTANKFSKSLYTHRHSPGLYKSNKWKHGVRGLRSSCSRLPISIILNAIKRR